MVATAPGPARIAGARDHLGQAIAAAIKLLDFRTAVGKRPNRDAIWQKREALLTAGGTFKGDNSRAGPPVSDRKPPEESGFECMPTRIEAMCDAQALS